MYLRFKRKQKQDNSHEMRVQSGSSIPEHATKETEISWRSLKLRILIIIQSAQDKAFCCLLLTVVHTIISIISSTILKLHMGLALFLHKIGSHEFIGGYPYFYSHCAGMLKQNHWEQRPMCSAKIQVHIARRIMTFLRGQMAYRWRNVISDCRKWTLQLTLKCPKWCFIFYFDCFDDNHIDFLLQSEF